DPIPLARTNSPYSLNQALGDLGATVAGLDTQQLDRTLNALSQTFADTPAPFRSALDGITALSRTLNARDEARSQLLARAKNVSGVLAGQSQQVDALLVDGNELLGELDARRAALGRMIVNIDSLARQLRGVVADNEAQLAPALDKLNSVLALLERNRDH